MDPFHDFNLQFAGLPDKTTGNSVVRFYKKKLSISKPAGLGATDKWDCHIFSLPIFDALTAGTRTVKSNNDINDGEVGDIATAFGTYTIVSGQADGEWFSPTTGIKGTSAVQYVVPDLSLGRRALARVIGAGFEIHNDTPSLYKGGSVTVYDCPQGDFKDQVFTSSIAWSSVAGTPYASSGQFTTLRRPPDNVSQAMQMPNSVTWEAADGCYVVNKIDLEHVDYHQPTNKPCIFLGSNGGTTATITSHKELISTWNSSASLGVDYYGSCQKYYGYTPLDADPCYRLTGMHTSGAYFNGLTPETVLTLEVHIIVESLPVNDPSELALASPSAEYDPAALQLYERSIRKLKSGVPVHMNAKGDWWKMVGNTLLQAAPMVANAIIPGSGVAVSGLINAGRAAKNAYDSKKQQKQATMQNSNVFRQNAQQVPEIRKQTLQPAKQFFAQPPKQKRKNKKKNRSQMDPYALD